MLPQAAFTVLTRGLMNRWTLIVLTIPVTEEFLQPLEGAICCQFLPVMTERQSFSDIERELLSLPARHSGLGMPVPTENANIHYSACTSVTAPFIDLICHRHCSYPTHVRLEQRQRKATIHSNNHSETLTKANSLKSTLPASKQRGMEQASEKGASSWLVTTPLAKYGFSTNRPFAMPSV